MSRSSILIGSALLGLVALLTAGAGGGCGSSTAGAGGDDACESSGTSASCPVPCDATKHPGATQGTPCEHEGETCMSMEPACGQTCTVTCQNGLWGQADCSMISPTC